jgi:hypothetical protein
VRTADKTVHTDADDRQAPNLAPVGQQLFLVPGLHRAPTFLARGDRLTWLRSIPYGAPIRIDSPAALCEPEWADVRRADAGDVPRCRRNQVRRYGRLDTEQDVHLRDERQDLQGHEPRGPGRGIADSGSDDPVLWTSEVRRACGGLDDRGEQEVESWAGGREHAGFVAEDVTWHVESHHIEEERDARENGTRGLGAARVEEDPDVTGFGLGEGSADEDKERYEDQQR